MDWACWLLCTWDFPGENTGVGYHFLLPGVKSTSPALADRFFTDEPPGKPMFYFTLWWNLTVELGVGDAGWGGETPLCLLLLLLLSRFSLVRLCDPMDCSRQAPLSMDIFQARTPEWVAKPSSRGSSQIKNRTRVSYCLLLSLMACIGHTHGKKKKKKKKQKKDYQKS